MKYGLLIPASLRRKPLFLMQSVKNAAQKKNIDHRVSRQYQPCETLVLYGWGGDIQQQAIEKHKGNYVALDLGYWLRDGTTHRHWRVSINGFHSPQLIMRGTTPPSSRFLKAKMTISPDRRNDGHILLIGNAPKSNKVIPGGWSDRKSRELQSYFPNKEIHYRGKPYRPIEKRVKYHKLSTGPIDDEIRKASLVVCRHSNVAVDACRLGVPVVCEDGAAAAIYPSDLKRWQKQPTFEQRKDFMTRLAWWQWSIADIKSGSFWPWLERQLGDL